MANGISRHSSHHKQGRSGFRGQQGQRLGFREHEVLGVLVQGGIEAWPERRGYRVRTPGGQICSLESQRVNGMIAKGLLRVREQRLYVTAKGAYYHATNW